MVETKTAPAGGCFKRRRGDGGFGVKELFAPVFGLSATVVGHGEIGLDKLLA